VLTTEASPTRPAERKAQLAPILVVDDEPLMREFALTALERLGYAGTAVATAEDGLAYLQREPAALALLDIRLGGMNGLELLARMRSTHPDCACIMMTAHATVETAVRAMRAGAADFLLKPFTAEALGVVIEKVLGVARLQRENRHLRARLTRERREAQIIGRCPQVQQMIELARTLAAARATVLITGESGTGKELVARALHAWGPRAEAPFVRVNCAALPAGLMESELFGHEKGAFTGASAMQRGKFELAHGGSILLDEVSEMDVALQPKLLRCLQEKEFYRVGGTRPLQVDARILATTNADLGARVRSGRFRTDLLYRLNVVPIHVPPLRDRREDIPLLAHHFLERAAAENGREARAFDRQALERLMAHSWPGNVRELENVVERAVVVCPGRLVRSEHLLWEAGLAAGAPLAVSPAGAFDAAADGGAGLRADPPGADRAPRARPEAAGDRAGPRLDDAATLRDVERAWILHALDEEGGNKTRAARRLGISVRTIRNKLAQYAERKAA